MTTPFNTKLRELRKRAGLTQEQLAEIVGASTPTISDWENSLPRPRLQKHLDALCSFLNISESDLIYGAEVKSFGLPLVASAEPGYLPRGGFAHAGEFSDPDGIEDVLVEVPKSVADNHPEGRVYRVDGDCMNRVYPEGCQLVADPAVEPQNGSAVCMAAESGDVIMRRMYRLAGQLILSPDSFNPEHENMIFDDPDAAPLTYLGTVVWFQAAEEMR